MKKQNTTTIISIGDLAVKMTSNLGTLLEVKVANNPSGVYSFLKIKKGVSLPFEFDKKALFGQLAQMIKRGDTQTIAEVLKDVPYISDVTSEGALAQASANGALWSTLGVNAGDFYSVFCNNFLKTK